MYRPQFHITLSALFLVGALFGSSVSGATGPVAPQSPGQYDPCGDGDSSGAIAAQNPATGGINDRSACIDPGQSLFVDPTAGNFGATQGPCRYVTNGDTQNLYIPTDLPQEYQDFRGGFSTGTAPPNVTETVCCRPGTATLCTAAAGGAQSAPIMGLGTNGYGQLASTGTATATCSNEPFGDYVETQSFVCGQVGTGINADGNWGGDVADNPQCGPLSAYATYGGCSTSCGSGNLYATQYNVCGQVVSQGYSGPACSDSSGCPPPSPPPAPPGPTYCAPGTTIAACSIWPAYTCTDPVTLQPTQTPIFSDCGGSCGKEGGAPSTWPTAGGTFTPPSCSCEYGFSASCPTIFGPTCYVCNYPSL